MMQGTVGPTCEDLQATVVVGHDHRRAAQLETALCRPITDPSTARPKLPLVVKRVVDRPTCEHLQPPIRVRGDGGIARHEAGETLPRRAQANVKRPKDGGDGSGPAEAVCRTTDEKTDDPSAIVHDRRARV